MKIAKEKGITLVALIITIIIMLILISVSVTSIISGNLFFNSIKATFYTEMAELEEKKELSKVSSYLVNGELQKVEENFLAKNLSKEEILKFDNTLKAEIIYIRNSFGNKEKFTTKQVWKNNLFECQDIYKNDAYLRGLTENIYYISKNVYDGKEKKYIYDSVSDTCFKIANTKIDKYVVHSLPYAKFAIDGINAKGIGVIDCEVNEMQSLSLGGSLCYEPDLNNFTYNTEIVYYSPDFKTQHTISIKQYLDENRPKTKQINGQTYIFANYATTESNGPKVWANIKCTANNLESWWVWIPRYAYKINENSGTIDVIFVSINNTQMNGEPLPEGYTVHEAFNQSGKLKGIWFSKYDPSYIETFTEDKSEPAMPNLNNFIPDVTEIVYYTSDCKNYITKPYSKNPPQTIEESGKIYYWYKYTNKIWANIRCTANDLESWWVWIPRYAYKIESGQIKVMLVDTSNKPIDNEKYGDTIPNGYTLHQAFEQDGSLEGIWFSKYDPTYLETLSKDTSEPATPNLNNFNPNETEIVYYTSDCKNHITRPYSKSPSQTVEEDGKTYYWYKYTDKIWANIRCTGNNLESWWVWIPRFAYKIESGQIMVMLVDTSNTPLDKAKYGDTIPDGYTLHQAFEQDGSLEGIWFSKYDPTKV